MSSAETVTVVSLSTACWGAEESLLLLAGAAPVPVRVAAPAGELLDRARAAGHATVAVEDPALLRLRDVGGGVGPAGLPSAVRSAAAAAARQPLWGDGPVVSFSQWLHLPLALAGRRRRSPVAVDLHDGPFRRGGAAVQAAAAWTAAAAVATSTTALRHVRSWPRGRTTVVPRPVRLPVGVRREPAAGGPLRLVVVGRLDPEKRLDVALDAHARLRALGVEAELDVVGAAHRGGEVAPGPQERWPHARFTGRLPHADALQLVAAADVLLSTAPGEAFGRTVAEAALLGVPAVVAGGGPAELVEHGRTGFVVPPGDPEALASALAALAGDRGRLAAVGAQARAHVARVCDPDVVARRWLRAVGAT